MNRRLILDFEEHPSFDIAQRLIAYLLRDQRSMDIAKNKNLTRFLTCDQEIFILKEILYGMRLDSYGMSIDNVDWERDSDANFLIGDSSKALLHMIEQIPFYENLKSIGRADFINNNRLYGIDAGGKASWTLRKEKYEKKCQKKLDKVLEEYFKKVLYDKRRGGSYSDVVSDKSMITLYSLGSIDFLKKLIKNNNLDFYSPNLADLGALLYPKINYFHTFRNEHTVFYFFSDLRDNIVYAHDENPIFSPEEFAWCILNNDTFVEYRRSYNFDDAEHILNRSSYEYRVEYLREQEAFETEVLEDLEDNGDLDYF